ncbi:MAG TPA: GTP-binding protein [Candidatus Sumerlaeota bacterium]|nr:GTP-binding protein [Candidatus Sumerlaeota bacterium]
MSAPKLILVGGFLGAGKTTLLWQAAQKLAGQGLQVGLVTNDQAPELVDTALLARTNVHVAEVSGSCFCCNFPGFLNALTQPAGEQKADVFIAEPVGSCTDLSATILQPLKDRHADAFSLAPLSVLVDPARLSDILSGGSAGLHPSAAYIFRKQMEEADFLVINKTDLLTAAEFETLQAQARQAFPSVLSVLGVSAKTGAGLGTWLEAVTRGTHAGHHLAEVDYDVYAEGEAVLGWLNTRVVLRGETEWDRFAENLLKGLSQRFDRMGASVGHVKILLESGDSYVTGNLTGPGETLSLRGSAKKGPEARLLLNARVEMSPEALEAVVRETLAAVCDGRIEAETSGWRCLSPGRPNPTYHYDTVVDA